MEAQLHQLPRLRRLGALERYLVVRGNMGIYHNVAVTACYGCRSTTVLKTRLFNAMASIIERHPILSAIPVGQDSASLSFARLPSIDLNESIRFETLDGFRVHGDTCPALDRFLTEKHNEGFEYTMPLSPYWRLYVLERNENQDGADGRHFMLSFVFHHAITDTRGALLLHEMIETALNESTDAQKTDGGIVPAPSTPIPAPLEDLLLSSSSQSAPPTPREAGNAWTGGAQSLPATTNFCSRWLSATATTQLLTQSRKHNVSLTAVLQTMLVAAVFEQLPVKYTTLRADCPLSLSRWLTFPSGETPLGVFTDSFHEIHNRGPFSWEEAKRTKSTIDRVTHERKGDDLCGNVSKTIDLEAYFQAKLGRPRDAALELSNVGRLPPAAKSSGDYWIESLLFSQSAGACSAAIKTSAVTGRDGRLVLGFSWQEGVVDNKLMQDVIGELDSLLAGITGN